MTRKTAVTAPQTLAAGSSINFEEVFFLTSNRHTMRKKRLHVSRCRDICVQILQLCPLKLKLSCKTLWPAAMVSTATTPKPFPSISTSSQDFDKPLLSNWCRKVLAQQLVFGWKCWRRDPNIETGSAVFGCAQPGPAGRIRRLRRGSACHGAGGRTATSIVTA